MIELIEAVVSTFNATSDLRTLLPGGIHLGIAPTGTNFDYVTFNCVPYPTSPLFGPSTRALGKLLVQFSIWSNKGASHAGTTATLLISTFCTPLSNLSAGGVTNAVLNNTPVPRVQTRKDKTGSTVVLVPVDILYSVELA